MFKVSTSDVIRLQLHRLQLQYMIVYVCFSLFVNLTIDSTDKRYLAVDKHTCTALQLPALHDVAMHCKNTPIFFHHIYSIGRKHPKSYPRVKHWLWTFSITSKRVTKLSSGFASVSMALRRNSWAWAWAWHVRLRKQVENRLILGATGVLALKIAIAKYAFFCIKSSLRQHVSALCLTLFHCWQGLRSVPCLPHQPSASSRPEAPLKNLSWIWQQTKLL